MHISCTVCAQTVHDNIKELKRLICDAFLYRFLPYNDLIQTVNVVPTSYDIKLILSLYKSLQGKQEKLIIHSLNDQIEIRD
jgi:hypothetical protein